MTTPSSYQLVHYSKHATVSLSALTAGPQKGDDLFGVNDSDEFIIAIDYGEGAEIVFVE